MKAPLALLIALATGGAALVSATAVVRSAAGDATTGLWTAEPATWKTSSARGPLVQLTLNRRHGRNGHSNHSNAVALSELKGLTAEQMSAAAANVSFALERDAGRFSFEGSFRGGEGAGHFTFTPRPEFVAAMQQLGYTGLGDEKIYTMAVLDVSRDFVKQLDALGYSRLDLDDLLSLRIHGADPTFIRAMKDLGYDRLPVDDLVSLRIHGATPDFVRKLRGLGYERVSADELVSMRIHGVSPDFVRRVKARQGAVSIDRLVEMRIHGIQP